MANVSQYSTTDASNNSAAPDGFPEGMPPSGVNDAARAVMGSLARWYAGLKGAITATGSANAYVLSTGSTHTALTDIGLVVIKAGFTNTSSATIAVDGLAATTIKINGAALVGGEIVSGETYLLVYNATNLIFELFGAGDACRGAKTPYTAAQYFVPTSVTSTTNSVAINMVTNQYCKHTLTENTTIAAPSNAAEGMVFRIMVTQDASSAKTLAWDPVFEGSIPTMPATLSAKAIYYFECYDGTNFIFTGWSGEF